MEGRNAGTPDQPHRKETAEPQEVAQAKLEAFWNHANTGVAVYRAENDGDDFIFVGFNRAAEEIERIGRAEVIGRSVLEIFPGVREFGLFDVFQRVWKTGKPESHPISVYKDERISGWRQNYVCRLPNGQIMAVYDDVTLSKRSELAARMSEQCFRAIANYTYDWEVWVGPTGRVLWTNPAVTRVTGYSIKELTVMPDYPQPLVMAGDRDRIGRAFQSALKGSTGNDVQFRMERKNGQVIWAEMSWQPIYDEDGHSLGHRESIRDITDRKQIEGALKQAEREKESILDSLAEHVVHQDVDMTVLWANRAACESLGLSREEVIGAHCYELWADRHDPCKDCPVAQAMETGCRAEVEKSTPDGRVWFIQGTPVRNEDGAVVGGVEITLDITRYKRSEEELRKLREECRLLREELQKRQ
jgi:PAS domain S-box-containing protein